MLKRVKELFEVIKNAEAELKEIRDKCKHKKTFVGNWSNRPGQICTANICERCQNFVSLAPSQDLNIFGCSDTSWNNYTAGNKLFGP